MDTSKLVLFQMLSENTNMERMKAVGDGAYKQSVTYIITHILHLLPDYMEVYCHVGWSLRVLLLLAASGRVHCSRWLRLASGKNIVASAFVKFQSLYDV